MENLLADLTFSSLIKRTIDNGRWALTVTTYLNAQTKYFRASQPPIKTFMTIEFLIKYKNGVRTRGTAIIDMDARMWRIYNTYNIDRFFRSIDTNHIARNLFNDILAQLKYSPALFSDSINTFVSTDINKIRIEVQ